MKFPEGQPIRWRTIWAVVILRTDIKVRATSGRRCLSIERARQKAVANYVCRGRWSEKAHDRRVGITSQSLGAVQRISAYTGKIVIGQELACTEVIGVRPHASFGIVGEIRSGARSEEHTSELQSRRDLVCRLLL